MCTVCPQGRARHLGETPLSFTKRIYCRAQSPGESRAAPKCLQGLACTRSPLRRPRWKGEAVLQRGASGTARLIRKDIAGVLASRRCSAPHQHSGAAGYCHPASSPPACEPLCSRSKHFHIRQPASAFPRQWRERRPCDSG